MRKQRKLQNCEHTGGHPVATGPDRTSATLSIAAAQLHQSGLSWVAQHFGSFTVDQPRGHGEFNALPLIICEGAA